MTLFLFDMGLPMIFPSVMLMAVALVPVVFIEAYVVACALRMNITKVIAPVTIANLVSTFLGVPVTWFVLALLQFGSVILLGTVAKGIPSTNLFSLTLGAPWVYPGHDNEKLIILGAMLFLLIPYGLASWAIECLVVKAMLEKKHDFDDSSKKIKAAMGKANLISYLLLAVFVVLFWGITIFGSNSPN